MIYSIFLLAIHVSYVSITLQDLTPEDRKEIINGCGPKWLTDKLSGWWKRQFKKLFDLIFGECCNQHDLEYWIGGTEEDRKASDLKFYRCMKKRIKKSKKNWFKKLWYKFIAWKYYKLVSKLGKSAFYYTDTPRTLADLPHNQ